MQPTAPLMDRTDRMRVAGFLVAMALVLATLLVLTAALKRSSYLAPDAANHAAGAFSFKERRERLAALIARRLA